jgi:hypothetical protein
VPFVKPSRPSRSGYRRRSAFFSGDSRERLEAMQRGMQAVLFLGGAILIGAAAIWAIRNNNESVALGALGGGLLLVCIGYLGQRVNSVKLPGGIEASLLSLADGVQKTLDDPKVPEAVKYRLAEKVPSDDPRLPAGLARTAGRIKSQRQQAMDYERALGAALQSVAANKWAVDVATDACDFLVTDGAARGPVGVEAKWSEEAPSPERVSSWLARLSYANRAAGRASLLVVSSPLAAVPSEVVVWRNEMDNSALAQAVRDALDRT